MKPAIFTLYPYPKQGGCFRQLSLAVKAAADKGIEAHYLSAKPFFAGGDRLAAFHKFPFYCRNELLFYAVFYALSPLLIFFIAARHGIRHFIVFNEEFAALCAPAAILCGARITLLMQGSMEHLIRSRRLPPPVALLLRIYGFIGIRAASRVLAVSKDLAQRSRRYYGFKKGIGVFPNYPARADIDNAKVVDLWKGFGIPKGSFVIAYSGSLIPRKNVDYLLEEFRAASIPGGYLILAGDGSEMARLKGLAASLGISGNVIFAGAREDRLDIVKSADLFVLPSFHDDCPLALLEALALGIPCLASNKGGVPEILRDDGLMFDPCAAGALSKMLSASARDKDYLRNIRALCPTIDKYWMEEIGAILRGATL
ncbi:MAG: glycosyltransferase [Candidatus Omnitrophica bacterium]|nr:glycosyltransferase [Candidatus Omnitrophota bacterium]MDD5736722.1 glycosyltransferase [Candidatus Omnitrophota bacterium]